MPSGRKAGRGPRRLLVTGAAGMLGSAVVEAMRADWDISEADLADFDISNEPETTRAVMEASPQVVVNCAAYTDVDGAESDREAAFAVNASGAGIVARAAAAAGARIVHISTDYVFDGESDVPYTEDDEPGPLCVYGESKLAGEREVAASGAEHLILRTAWLYGHGGGNFVETVLRLAREGGPLRIVDDQTGQPTFAGDLALMIKELAPAASTGILNATNSGSTTWYGFARRILEEAGITGVDLEPVSSAEFQRPAPRPRSSLLSLSRLERALGWAPRQWQDALAEYLSER